jgi:YVTN family beta-propeller protein
VASFIGGGVLVIDSASNTVRGSVGVDGFPLGIAVNPAGTRVYVANSIGNVSVIDTANNTVTATVAVGAGPHAFGLFIGPSGPAVPSAIPTIHEWGLVLLSFLLSVMAWLRCRSARRNL